MYTNEYYEKMGSALDSSPVRALVVQYVCEFCVLDNLISCPLYYRSNRAVTAYAELLCVNASIFEITIFSCK